MLENTKNIMLQTEDLTIGYAQKKGDKIVLSKINIAIESGKLISVLGKNGIGKSTLLRTLSNVQKPISGDVYFEEKSLHSYSENALSKKLSLVLTERLPESQLTVFELIALGRQPYTNWIDSLSAGDIEKINAAMRQTEITHLKNALFYELSDGQLQRVLIARALAQDTAVIILDEPTAHLDMHQTINIFVLLQKLVKETNKTIIISSHEINLALKLSDQIILMTENKVQFGTTAALISQSAFDTIFPDTLLQFDKTIEQFVIKNS
ncbi:MAG: ABC transporter ATP-binding protein [Polaribacter sp.]|jgi:iron complex transport system ATP-binding protein|nr:ABC transporter ATP-binding protein [Polaribacter sp.]|tara:strand:- start:4275 stop:5072 length:798 start_codon:yes stop_codon:yes gene_type:complete